MILMEATISLFEETGFPETGIIIIIMIIIVVVVIIIMMIETQGIGPG